MGYLGSNAPTPSSSVNTATSMFKVNGATVAELGLLWRVTRRDWPTAAVYYEWVKHRLNMSDIILCLTLGFFFKTFWAGRGKESTVWKIPAREKGGGGCEAWPEAASDQFIFLNTWCFSPWLVWVLRWELNRVCIYFFNFWCNSIPLWKQCSHIPVIHHVCAGTFAFVVFSRSGCIINLKL